MELKEIYSTIVSHMIKGMMIHAQLADYYDFLGLQGYKRCHEYHFMQESCEYRGVSRYFINHHNMLIPEERIEDPNIIPESWYQHVRNDVDENTKKNAVRSGLKKWVDWETETKDLYQRMYQELMSIGEIVSACKIKELVCGVDQELKKAERYWLNKEAMGWDMPTIISEQQKKHDKYKKKMEKIGVIIC